MIKKITAMLLASALLFTGCGSSNDSGDIFTLPSYSDGTVSASEINFEFEYNNDFPQFREFENGDTLAKISTTEGDILVRLLPEVAPLAVENFVTLSEDGYYDGIIFHRVIEDFMIQGGDPTGTGMGGESAFGEAFEDEFDSTARNFYGSLSMANAGANTNGSQFFIVQANEDTITDDAIEYLEIMGDEAYPADVRELYAEIGGTFWLDYGHTVFGQVVEGMDTVNTIATVNKNASDKPVEDVVINSIEILEYQD